MWSERAGWEPFERCAQLLLHPEEPEQSPNLLDEGNAAVKETGNPCCPTTARLGGEVDVSVPGPALWRGRPRVRLGPTSPSRRLPNRLFF